MIEKPLDPCSSCRLWRVTHNTKRSPYFVTHEGQGFCDVEGYPHLGVAFMGAASDEHSETDGLPLRSYSRGGSIHTRTLRSLYVSRGQVQMFNALACRPPNNWLSGAPYEYDAISHCAPIRNARLRAFHETAARQPGVSAPVIVALGDIAFRTLTGITADGTNKMGISYIRGYPVETPYGIVIGTYDPGFVRQHTKLMPVLTDDYRRAFRIARHGLEYLPVNSIVRPSVSQLQDLRDLVHSYDWQTDKDKWLIFDFETDNIDKTAPRGSWPRLQSVQFSTGPDHAMFLDYNRDTHPIIQAILGSQCAKAGHNIEDFDLPVAKFHQLEIGGLCYDSLWMYHHLQPDLTIEDAGAEAEKDFRFSTAAGLQYIASFFGADSALALPGETQKPGWKHLRHSTDAAQQELYGNLDVANNSRIMYGCKGYASLPAQMKEKGIWDGYESYVRQFYPVLKGAATRGIPIDRQRQWNLDRELAAVEIEIDNRIQAIHPNELKRIDPPSGFKKDPQTSKLFGTKIRRTLLPLIDAEILQVSQPGAAIEVRYIYEWLDEAEDISAEDRAEMIESGENDVIVHGLWRPMVQRKFHEKEIKTKSNCDCLHIPPKGKGLKAFGFTHRPARDCARCGGKGIIQNVTSGEVIRWARLLPFRPSNKQLISYIEFRKHKVPKDRRTDKKTTAAKKIQELVVKTGDPLYQGVLDIRTVEKVRGTYVNGIGWVEREWVRSKTTDETGEEVDVVVTDKRTGATVESVKLGPILPMEMQPPRIHTTFTLGPATGQCSSRRPNVQNCFSPDTEILTRNGWVRFDCLDASSIDVAQYDASTNQISFAQALEQIRQEYSGPMLEITTEEQLNMCVTPDHECLVQNRRSNKFKKVAARAYPLDMLQLQAGSYSGGSNHWRRSQVTLAAALQADGHARENGAYDFSFKKRRKYERFEEALLRENIKYTEYPRRDAPGYKRFYIAAKDVPKWWQGKKFLGPWLLELDQISFGWFADELFLWDGCSTTCANYASGVKVNTDWAQILFTLTNRRAHMRLYTSAGGSKSWQVDVSKRPTTSTANHTKTCQPYQGIVHCVTVPSGNIIVRRRNRVMITGNCPKHVRNENLRALNIPKKLRSMIVARPGHRIWEFDLKSAHALTLGLNARDLDYMRLARLDVHSYFTSVLMTKQGLWPQSIDLRISDSDLKAALKEVRKFIHPNGTKFEEIRNVRAKSTILGIGFGMQGRKLYEQNKDSFDNEYDAQDVINTFFEVFPKLMQYQTDVLAEAHDKKYLRSRGGFMRWFWHVYDFIYDPTVEGKFKIKHGDDAEDVKAFRPANDAFVYIRDIMCRLEEMEINERCNFINTVHDSLVFEIPDAIADEYAPIIKREIEKPQILLGDPIVAPDGLYIECEAACGQDWGSIKEVNL